LRLAIGHCGALVAAAFDHGIDAVGVGQNWTRERLGYGPTFDPQHGPALSEGWARWCGLLV
jgi:hypothetical protein